MSPIRSTALFAVLVFAGGCTSGMEPVGDAGAVPTAAAPRVESLPRALTADEQKLISASNDFSLMLFRQLNAAQKDSNIFTSPLSASISLAMLMTGASGATYEQMHNTLLLRSTTDVEVTEGYKSLVTLLRVLDPASDVRIATSLWTRNGIPITPAFLDAGMHAFNATVGSLDFASASAAGAINAWAADATLEKLPAIIDHTDARQSMLLMNAVLFKGTWSVPFDVALTGPALFRGAAGNQTIPMMTRGDMFGYYASGVFEAVDLPYGNGAYSMTIVLPRSGQSMDAVAVSIQGLSGTLWSERLRILPMQLFLPRFRIEWEQTLNADLKALGMTDAFTPGVADFGRLSSSGREIALDVVRQKTYVQVNEDGTEGAPTQALPPTPGIPFPLIMFVDRPFLVIIRERLTGTIIFVGKVTHIN
ncbi:MAG: hypothetical protein JWM95_2124 [Gemmatimonadetes bacterium]|nr:hypothetical protein [Gemmatimonadota bacterium]